MALFDIDDLREMFDIDEAAVKAYYAPVGKKAKNIIVKFPFSGEFSRASIDPFLREDEIPDFMALAITVDVPNVKHKDTLKIDDITYKIRRGKDLRLTGFTVLYLYE